MTNLKLKPRLLEIAKLIKPGSKIIDVGADHGLLDIYLNKSKNCTCLALDISLECIKKIVNNAVKYNANILVKLNDGLNNISLNDEIVVISGVGTRTIKKILKNDITNDLLLVSHTGIDELIDFLNEKNYKVIKRKEIIDKKKYTLLYAKTTR